MVYNTPNCCIFGLHPSSGILETRKHNISETASVSVLRWRGRDPYAVGSLRKWLRLALSKWRNRVGVPPPRLRTETDPVSETMCFLDSGKTGRRMKSETPAILSTQIREFHPKNMNREDGIMEVSYRLPKEKQETFSGQITYWNSPNWPLLEIFDNCFFHALLSPSLSSFPSVFLSLSTAAGVAQTDQLSM
jgi:hypothetical protein